MHGATTRFIHNTEFKDSLHCCIFPWKLLPVFILGQQIFMSPKTCEVNKFKFYVISDTEPSHKIYLLTPWCRVLPEQLTGLQLVKKFPAFNGTRRFITALTSVRHLSVSWASPIQSIYPHSTSGRYVLILSNHLRLGLLSGLFPSGFPTKTLYTPLSSPIRATCPAHLILLDFITRTILGEEYKTFSSSLCSLLQSPVISSLLGPNSLLNTL